MKPLLVGEDNPYGSDPEFALYPAPDGCAGHRLCVKILGLSRKDYLERFDRVNLCDGAWSMRSARKRAKEIIASKRRVLILLGAKVREAFGRTYLPFFVNTCTPEHDIVLLPHPSGRCLLWNRPGAIEEARALLYMLKVL